MPYYYVFMYYCKSRLFQENNYENAGTYFSFLLNIYIFYIIYYYLPMYFICIIAEAHNYCWYIRSGHIVYHDLTRSSFVCAYDKNNN